MSDENRFAHGPAIARWGKLLPWKLGLFAAAYRIKTLGRGHRFSTEDDVAYSFCVYDALSELSGWADLVFVIPTDKVADGVSMFHPYDVFHLLLCAFKKSRG